MTQWKKGTTEFTVSVTRNVKSLTNYSYIPKPILDMLGTPTHITFKVKNGIITVSAAKKTKK